MLSVSQIFYILSTTRVLYLGCSSFVVLGVTWIFMSNAVQGHFFVFDFVVFQTLHHTPVTLLSIWEKSNPTALVGKYGIRVKNTRKSIELNWTAFTLVKRRAQGLWFLFLNVLLVLESLCGKWDSVPYSSPC